jgi:hypothetical protein
MKRFRSNMSVGDEYWFPTSARIPFYHFIIVQIIDKDFGWPIDPDDFLGDARIPAIEDAEGDVLWTGMRGGSTFGTIVRIGAAISTYGASELFYPDEYDLILSQPVNRQSREDRYERLRDVHMDHPDQFIYLLEYEVEKAP